MSTASQLNEERILAAFKVADLNGDGVISMSDIDTLTSKLTASFAGASATATKAYKDAYHNYFSKVMVRADKNGDKVVTADEYLEFYRTASVEEIEDMTDEITECFFAVADTNNDGRLSKEEFTKHLSGLDPQDTYIQSFNRFSDGSGHMSKENYHDFLREYLQGGIR